MISLFPKHYSERGEETVYTKQIISSFHQELDQIVSRVIKDHVDENKETIYSQINKIGNEMVQSFSMEKLSPDKELLKSYYMLNSFFKEYLRILHSIVYKYNRKKSIIVIEDFHNKCNQYHTSITPMRSVIYDRFKAN